MTTKINIEPQFNKLKETFYQKVGQLQALQKRASVCQTQVESLTYKEDTTIKASLFLQSLSDQARLQVLDKISGIVTDALQTVKDKNLVFEMSLVTKANQPTLEMGILDKKTGQTYDILNSMGGGVADITSLVLRIALLCKWQPNLSRVLVLDEMAKHVAVKDQELLADFVRKMSEALNLQMIWISHSDVLKKSASKVFEVTNDNGTAKVEEKTSF